jgi:hypothetical protein
MIRRAVLAALLGAAPPLAAQVPAPDSGAPRVARAEGALLRALDKVTGQTRDLALKEGDSARVGRITVQLGQCRYPADDPASDAYAWVTVIDDAASAPAFRGWMIASSPALNALDHPRYDVWVIRCNIPGG